MTSPNIAIIGSALSGNKGASAMLEAAVQTLSERLDNPTFTLLSMYPEEDAALNPYPNLNIVAANAKQLGVTINSLALAYRVLPFLRGVLRSRSEAIRALSEADILLDQGGITFTDGREKFLLYNIASILPAINVKTPVFKCAQAVGPFRNPVNRWASRTFLPKVRTLVTRGRITHEYAEGLGLSNIVAGADYAFSLELAGTEATDVSNQIDLTFFDEDVVGVCPSVVLQKKVDARGGDYVGQMVAFIEHLRSEGKRVMLIPHSVRTGTEKTHNNDLPLCRAIHSRLRLGSDLLFVDRELTSQQLRFLIGQCSLFVASRFHAMVSSLAMAVPTLVIGWSHKYREVLEMFELEDWAFGHDKLTLDYLTERFSELSAQREAVKAKLDSRLPSVKARSVMQADLIADVVRTSRGVNA
ncbi:polysaccharide pyruvyl transferase WcaK-like protein [Microbacterium halimionae]|uniref:Polysaccharide pyruvyl transferase WcaK-like protein n=1 Tax=Microbacterium halimionae TaxID=1526413 RepID=A0A7W3JPJ6_9MICO|nr:polysaccharide pyruvyl transferase family protein [Microbacterium halimionae]MBA8816653.1 polysaccharide pyruvyl transferase WcaK-like protein [Microbacterium halimionae]NII95160.1 polysaccharide pyruvyl transferase WcaK-like protein [Microbacterium halimionae]